MSVLGFGIDIVSVPRIARMIDEHGERLLTRCFTPREQADCLPKRDRTLMLAARFAAKEALFKAIGTGWSAGVAWTDAEIRRTPTGKPDLILSGKALHVARGLGATRALVSLSHADAYAVASVILVR